MAKMNFLTPYIKGLVGLLMFAYLESLAVLAKIDFRPGSVTLDPKHPKLTLLQF